MYENGFYIVLINKEVYHLNIQRTYQTNAKIL